jgi:hypothetical protein
VHAIRKINQHRARKDQTKQASYRSAGDLGTNQNHQKPMPAEPNRTRERNRQAGNSRHRTPWNGTAFAPSDPRALYTAPSSVSPTKREGTNAERKNRHRTPLGSAPLGDQRWPRKPDAWRALGCCSSARGCSGRGTGAAQMSTLGARAPALVALLPPSISIRACASRTENRKEEQGNERLPRSNKNRPKQKLLSPKLAEMQFN